VLKQGLGYLKAQRYELLSDWTNDAKAVDPATIDWRAIADGHSNVRVRQLPGSGNAMGKVKFTTRNDYGIYLHDTPNKELFLKTDRWQSNGCVRVEDAPRLARWLFGGTPTVSASNPGEIVPLDRPVPVYITYLTATVAQTGNVTFRHDTYRRDDTALAGLSDTKASFASR
jgi:murein L,D-transpeptidase YcbB/YkuD